MRLDELFEKLNELDYIENYFLSTKGDEDLDDSYRVLKIYADAHKIAEISIDRPYMLRTTYPGFDQLNLLEKQALFQLLNNFAMTPVTQRSSELYFAYFYDLNNISHFIRKLPNKRLTDDILPIASIRTMEKDQLLKYLFTIAEFENFPKDYQPRFTPDSFVKVTSQEEMEILLEERFNRQHTEVDTNIKTEIKTEDEPDPQSNVYTLPPQNPQDPQDSNH